MARTSLEIAAKLFYRTILTHVVNPQGEEIKKEGLTPVQLSCMYFVYVHHEPSVGSIAEGLRISNAATVKLIDRLVKKDFLVREEDKADRRMLKIKLTAPGLELVKKHFTGQTKLFNKIIERMSPEGASALETGLTAFLSAALVTPEQIEEICLMCGFEHLPDCPGNVRYKGLTGRNKEQV
ncbi:MAG: MarR family transcriptional regulator [Clostridia bacterium]|jgi:DNA-binding MarR family transcriptional regulator|nr:MarR family transcriptional regulator [Clostridia bacterium]